MKLNIRDNNFDIIRLILAILVGLYHWNILIAYNSGNLFFNFGEIAVDCFFIVSGFLIFWSFDNDKDNKKFYIKRFYRIFPIYFIGFSQGNLEEIFRYFISNLLFLNFLSPSVGETLANLEVNAINGSLWALKNEVMFYVLVPLVFLFYKKF